MPLGDNIRNDMKITHAKFHEFIRHRKGDINLSSFPFYEFCRMGQQEPLRFENMEMYTWLRGLQKNSFHICLSFILFAMIFQNQRIDNITNKEFAFFCHLATAWPAQEASQARGTRCSLMTRKWGSAMEAAGAALAWSMEAARNWSSDGTRRRKKRRRLHVGGDRWVALQCSPMLRLGKSSQQR
jgi:hypothetical protein